jgi:hypothetical protein
MTSPTVSGDSQSTFHDYESEQDLFLFLYFPIAFYKESKTGWDLIMKVVRKPRSEYSDGIGARFFQ